jgi:hypothetical protein
MAQHVGWLIASKSTAAISERGLIGYSMIAFGVARHVRSSFRDRVKPQPLGGRRSPFVALDPRESRRWPAPIRAVSDELWRLCLAVFRSMDSEHSSRWY